MRCPSCGFENPEGMNFCGRCGTQLSPRCPHCDFENPPGFAFCGKCGASLAEPTPAAHPQALTSPCKGFRPPYQPTWPRKSSPLAAPWKGNASKSRCCLLT